MLMRELAKMDMAILFMIINTQDMLTVQKLTLPALMRPLYLMHNQSFFRARQS